MLTISSALWLLVLLVAIAWFIAAGRSASSWVQTFDTRGHDGLLTQHNFDLTISRGPGFAWYSNDYNRWSYRQITVPLWAIVAGATLSTIAPVVSLTRRIRIARARRQGLCPRCNYDLRASREYCPECGTPIDGS